MGIDENGVVRCFPMVWGAVAKPCDYCKTSAAILFCRTDKAFMCIICDAGVHISASGVHSRHERVWMCEVCEQAPASVTCKADAAALCVTCDRDIHSANPLARRHERVAVVPFYDTAQSAVKSAAAFLVPNSDNSHPAAVAAVGGTPPGPFMPSNVNIPKVAGNLPEMKPFDAIFSNADQLLDFDYPVPTATCHQLHHLHDSAANDSVVPVQSVKPIIPPAILNHSPEIPFEIDFTRSDFNSYNYTAQSLSHSVSSSSMDVGVVPDWNSMTDISYPFSLQLNNSPELTNSASQSQSQPTQLSKSDREARVMRYREKRKNRKFEKTIRYASRKAYAETRPRIKGRFAKRTDTENNIDNCFIPNSTVYFSDSRYGVVPSY